MSKTLAIHTLGVYSPPRSHYRKLCHTHLSNELFGPFWKLKIADSRNRTSEIWRFFIEYLPSSLSVNLPNCGWSLNVSIQMTSSLANRTMAKSSCLINLIFPVFSPVFLSTLQMMFLSVTSSMMACKCRTNCLPGHMILV